MDFEDRRKEPLAHRMKPLTIDQFYGQKHILAPGKLLYRMISADRLSSVIFFGPPGTGKTSLARIIAHTTNSGFQKLNAVSAGVADIKKVVADAQNTMLNPTGRVVLFIDEIHRFNKAQQDALLPYVEDGTIILIGATTENPYFEVNKALISRSTVFQLKPLTEEDIRCILQAALDDEERGLGGMNVTITDEAMDFLCKMADGDARSALNALELAVLTAPGDKTREVVIDMDTASECVQKRHVRFDKSGEEHYDNISAFIKSMRGSDPDAAVFYLARALYAGEDINFLARRIIICASEDVGTANPNALAVAVAAAEACKMIGMPEARILLSQAAITVATSPKSNSSYMAINSALSDVENKNTGSVPMYLRNAPAKGMEELGYGVGYMYAHDYKGHVSPLEYLPEEMKGTKYYVPSENGYDGKIADYMKWVEKIKKEQGYK
ncbi:MAG: replication-associated recombination protein A [Ruminococcaceae bacterium]|nr:replication-associated recombination protein A [Oscillospiraceae bacterium]